MSVVIGIKTNKGVWLGADSALTSDDAITVGHSKLFRIGELLIGITGDFRVVNLMKYQFVVPPHYPDIDTDVYFGQLVVPAIIKCLEESGIMDDGLYKEEFKKSTEMLVAYQGSLFEIDCVMSFVEYQQFSAVGVGAEFAKGIYTVKKPKPVDPSKLIESILQLISENYISVREPFTILKQ